MSVRAEVTDLDLGRYLRHGDRIVIGQACGEPTTLVEALIAGGREIGGLSAFIATSFSGLFTPETADSFALSSMGAIGALRSMTKAHKLTVIPCHVGQVGADDRGGHHRVRRRLRPGEPGRRATATTASA